MYEVAGQIKIIILKTNDHNDDAKNIGQQGDRNRAAYEDDSEPIIPKRHMPVYDV